MQVVIRTDSSSLFGLGHLMRCLTLANELRDNGADVLFVCADLPNAQSHLAARRGFRVIILPAAGEAEDAALFAEALRGQKPDWVIVDHYGLGVSWERAVRAKAVRIMAIDDVEREHDCDLLLDQNLSRKARRYEGKIPRSCRALLGPSYALLRPQFRNARKRLRRRSGDINNILIFFGGGESFNQLEQALEAALAYRAGGLVINLIAGGANPRKEVIAVECAKHPNVHYHEAVEDMAGMMAEADIMLGAGGSVTWERCCLGLPALVAVTGDNQRELVEAVAADGALVNLGWWEQVFAKGYLDILRRMNKNMLKTMGETGMTLVDGEGAARVASMLLSDEVNRA